MPGRLIPLSLVLALLPQCRSAPASVLLSVETEPSLAAPDELRLTVLGAGGIEVKERRLPELGKPALPSSVVLYPRQAGVLRILVRALLGGARVGEGATVVEARGGAQVSATVTLRATALPDRDSDGFPDIVDSCPDWPNPEQSACSTDVGVLDGPWDVKPKAEKKQKKDLPGVDRGPDGQRDQAKLDQAKPKPDQPKPDQAKPKPDQPKPDQPKPDQPKPDQPKPDQAKPKPDLAKPDLAKPDLAKSTGGDR